jgi:hypothetical protein
LRQGSPTNTTYAESFPRHQAASNTAIAATGVVHSSTVPLQFGDVAGAVTFITATQAAVTPTAGYAALRAPDGTIVAQTANFADTARAANTVYKIAFTSPYLVTTPGLYIIDLSFTAGTVPTVAGKSVVNAVVNGAVVTGAPVLARTHGSSVGATPPATIATPTTVATLPWFAITAS